MEESTFELWHGEYETRIPKEEKSKIALFFFSFSDLH